MTANRDFKLTIRERMKKTGERYTAARAVLLQSRSTAAAIDSMVGLFPGYSAFGGVCRDTGAMRNVLAAAGVTSNHNRQALSEALVMGICGGIGFLYAVFQYKGWPPILSLLGRYDTMPDSYIGGGLARLSLRVSSSETGSAASARKALDAAIAEKKPALCVVDCVGLMDTTPGPMQMAGVAPTVVAVAGVDGDELLIDDGSVRPRRMSHERFAKARSLYKKGKHRLVTIDDQGESLDLRTCVAAAIRATADRYTNAPFKGFAGNFGFAGLEKWQRLLTDKKDAKGWPATFPEKKLAYLALRRTHDGIEHEFTAPAAGRPMYASFLAEAAEITAAPALERAAQLYRKSGEHWSAITRSIAGCGDATVERGCKLGDSARELFDEAPATCKPELEDIAREQTTLAQQCEISAAKAQALYADIAAHVVEIVAIEREAVAALQSATS